MKKLMFVFLIFSLSACNKNEYVYSVTYIYTNETSEDITVKIHRQDAVNSQTETSLDIQKGGSRELKFLLEREFASPLSWYGNRSAGDSIVIANTKLKFIQRLRSVDDMDKLYLTESYTLVSDEKINKTYQYIFTDEDFAGATPISTPVTPSVP